MRLICPAARVGLLCLGGLALFGQQPRSIIVSPVSPIGMPESVANLPAQKIGPNDLIMLQVYDAPELTRTVRVSDDGFIRLPMLSARIPVQGLMPSEVETVVEGELEKEGILVSPTVTVTIAEYSSHPISVMGAVKSPMTFQATTPVTLLDALARAGGLGPDAGYQILISHKQPGDEEQPQLVQRIPVKGLIDMADPQYNILLHGGEEVRVPEIGKVFIVGNVKKPGAYPVQDGDETTILQMLALAEGLAPYASKDAYIYRRETKDSKTEIPVEMQKLLDRKTPDIQLEANDILYVPDNRRKRTTMAVLEKLLTFGAGTASGVIIYGTTIRH